MLCGAALPSLAWQRHLDVDLAGFEGKFEMGKTAVEYGAPVGEEFYGQVTRDFLETSFDLSGRAAQVFIVCIALAAGAVLYARFHMKKRWRLRYILPAAIVMVVLYYVGMLYMYLYFMPAEEALRLAGFERYACSVMTLFAGVLIMGAAVDMEGSFAVDIDERGAYRAYSSPGAKRRYQYAVLVTILIGVNFLYSRPTVCAASGRIMRPPCPAGWSRLWGTGGMKTVRLMNGPIWWRHRMRTDRCPAGRCGMCADIFSGRQMWIQWRT